MKKLLILLALPLLSLAQESTNFSITIDPNATIKEKSINATFELEHVSYLKYVKASIQVLPDLEGGYIDFCGGFGMNYQHEDYRIYGGGRLGLIRRSSYTYPLVGYEAGINFNVGRTIYLGLRYSADYRSDFEFWGGTAELRHNGGIKIGFNL